MTDERDRAEDINIGTGNETAEPTQGAQGSEGVQGADDVQSEEDTQEIEGNRYVEDDEEQIIQDFVFVPNRERGKSLTTCFIVVFSDFFFFFLVQCPLCHRYFRGARGVQSHLSRSSSCNQERANIFTNDQRLIPNPNNLQQSDIPAQQRRNSLPTQHTSVSISESVFLVCYWVVFSAEKICLYISYIYFLILILSNSSYFTFSSTIALRSVHFLEEFKPNPIGTMLNTVRLAFRFLVDIINA